MRQQNRFAMQEEGQGIYLLAVRDAQYVGEGTLLWRSKYPAVRRHLRSLAEINGLAADPQGQGIGSQIIESAVKLAATRGKKRIGLAVQFGNDDARRLYERLGYVDWGRGTVTDSWSDLDDSGRIVREHSLTCSYLVKALERSAEAAKLAPRLTRVLEDA
jgi:RimJ/RimL family protein N-acetyltransferase